MVKQINLNKPIKRYGNNLVIVFTAEEEEIYDMKEGDILDVSDMINEKEGNKK